MAEIYTYMTQATAKQQIANRLFDPTKVFWTDAELTLYLQEALRTWNSLASYWRGDFTFSTQVGVIYYDLTNTTQMPNTLRPLTLHDTDIYSILQYHLLEPVNWNPWTGNSAQFAADDLLEATSRRRDEVLGVSGCTVTQSSVGAVNGRIALADNVIDVRSMFYIPALGSPSVMWPEDIWALQSFQISYLQNPPGTPFTYMLSTEPPISFDTDRPPGAAGSYELLTVNAGPALTVPTPSLLSIPDDWTYVIKWGALFDLLSRESNSRDSLRATYAEQRYRMGLKLLSQAPAILAIRSNNANIPIQIDALAEANRYRTGWRAESPGAPNAVFQTGLNLLALAPPPDSGGGNNYSFTATVVENAPIPANDADFIQVARDDLDVVLGYAQHLAAFKMGGSEFTDTIPLLERFFKQAEIYGLKLKELGEFTHILYSLSQGEEYANPRLAAEVAPDAST